MSKTGASSAARKKQAENAAAKRWDQPNKDEIAREYAELRISEFVSNVVSQAPPLTDQQVGNIAALLRAGGDT